MSRQPAPHFKLAHLHRQGGFTIVELLVALTLTLMLMTAVVRVFSAVGEGISRSRHAMEAFDSLRACQNVLRQDLGGVTVIPKPPVRPEDNSGYLEIIEGGDPQLHANAVAAVLGYSPVNTSLSTTANFPVSVSPSNALTFSPSQPLPVLDSDATNAFPDSTVGQRGDILMLTTRNSLKPFVGRFSGSSDGTITSDSAEVLWFLRGTTLHRRVLLIVPGVAQTMLKNRTASDFLKQNYYAKNDVSARVKTLFDSSGNSVGYTFVPNSLSDLAKRENRYGHPTDTFPFDVRRWGLLGLPTLAECAPDAGSLSGWMDLTNYVNTHWNAGTVPTPSSGTATIAPPNPPFRASVKASLNLAGTSPPDAQNTVVDVWKGSANSDVDAAKYSENYLLGGGTTGSVRAADDVILTNVIGFDVKVWDPYAPIYTLNGESFKPGDARYADAVVATGAVPSGYGAFVDLGWKVYHQGSSVTQYQPQASIPWPYFAEYGTAKSGLSVDPGAWTSGYSATMCPSSARVYDTWSTSYENEGIYYWNGNGSQFTWQWVPSGGSQIWQPASVNSPTTDSLNSSLNNPYYPFCLPKTGPGTSTNGFDNDNNGIVNDAGESITAPPYAKPLRGIQVRIRVYEPDSRQIREVVVEQDFLAK